MTNNRGYTLVELMVAVGLFAIIMLLASGAYLVMIGANRQAQGMATGINDISFALETMTRTMRTGIAYGCNAGGDCASGGTSFSFRSEDGSLVSYSLVNGRIQQTIDSVPSMLTDTSVTITSLKFFVIGTGLASNGDYTQARALIAVSGWVSSSSDKTKQSFAVETGATMRSLDL